MLQLSELVNNLTQMTILTQKNIPFLCWMMLLLWATLALSTLSGNRLLALGISPRRLYGLPGIFFAPFLHANATHLFFNSIPLIVLSDFLLFNGTAYFIIATIKIALISGFLIWCFAKKGIHVGASAIITGYWGLLVCNSYQQGSVTAIFLGIICIYYFAGIFYSIFPSKQGVSWEGHLFGLIAGVAISNIPWYTLLFKG